MYTYDRKKLLGEAEEVAVKLGRYVLWYKVHRIIFKLAQASDILCSMNFVQWPPSNWRAHLLARRLLMSVLASKVALL